MKRTALISAALAGLVAFTSVPAFANDISIRQYGWGHSAGGAQHGFRNRIGIHQDGRRNAPRPPERPQQRRRDRPGRPAQRCRHHDQRGRDNAAGLAQFGSRHESMHRPARQATMSPASRSDADATATSPARQGQCRRLRPDLQLISRHLVGRVRPSPSRNRTKGK
jgi:minor curlin subunit